jgi:hypothetical protein
MISNNTTVRLLCLIARRLPDLNEKERQLIAAAETELSNDEASIGCSAEYWPPIMLPTARRDLNRD